MSKGLDNNDMDFQVKSSCIYQMTSPNNDGKSMLCIKEPRNIQDMFKGNQLSWNYEDEEGCKYAYYFIAQMQKPFTGEILQEMFECESDKQAEDTRQHLLRKGWLESSGIKTTINNIHTEWGSK